MGIMSLNRTETIEFGAFVRNEYKGKQKKEKRATGKNKANESGRVPYELATIPIVGHMLFNSTSVFASSPDPAVVAVPVGAMSDAVKEKIIHAFDPLIELMVGLSLPIAGVMLTGGALMIMIGQKDLGFRLIMNSALGYALVQMSPLFIDLLAGVGSAI